jgi:hypothetical protein
LFFATTSITSEVLIFPYAPGNPNRFMHRLLLSLKRDRSSPANFPGDAQAKPAERASHTRCASGSVASGLEARESYCHPFFCCALTGKQVERADMAKIVLVAREPLAAGSEGPFREVAKFRIAPPGIEKD